MFQIVSYTRRRPVTAAELASELARLSAEAERAGRDMHTKARLARTAMDMVADVSAHQQAVGHDEPSALHRLEFLGNVLTAAVAEVIQDYRS